MELADVSSVMKWVLLVLLAGFVGQFGKTLAQHILRKIRKEKQDPANEKRMVRETPVLTDKKLLKTLAKQKKKEAKKLVTSQD
jgi:hypothetical protein